MRLTVQLICSLKVWIRACVLSFHEDALAKDFETREKPDKDLLTSHLIRENSAILALFPDLA